MNHSSQTHSTLSKLTVSTHWSKPWVRKSAKSFEESRDLLVKWSVAAQERSKKRLPVNVCFVIDRSGSMQLPVESSGLSRTWTQPAAPTPFPGVQPFQPPQPWVQPDPFAPHPVGPVWVGHSQPSIVYGGVSNSAPAPMRSNANTQDAQAASANALQQIVGEAMGTITQPMIGPAHPVEVPKNKIDLAKDAAWSAIQTLGEDDRVSIVSFDSSVRVVCHSVSGSNKSQLRSALDSIVCGGATALFEGWRQGARCVAEAMKKGTLNRVLLLTDGQANHGETNLDKICSVVHSLSKTGVSTSTFGVGLDYNEDLLQAIAQSGDGQYYHISGSDDFLTLFADEFEGLSSVVGRQVRLEIVQESASGTFLDQPWATVSTLNEFVEEEGKKMRLPNLMSSRNVEAVFEVKAQGEELGVLSLRLTFVDADGLVQEVITKAKAPGEDSEDLATSKVEQAVVDAGALLRVAQQKKKAMEALDRGDVQLANATLFGATAFMANASVSLASAEAQNLSFLTDTLQSGDVATTRKTALYETYNTRNSKSR